MAELITLGLDMYGYVTFTTPEICELKSKINIFLDRLQNINYYLPLRVIPLEIQTYNANINRIGDIQKVAIQNQYDVVEAWSNELENRYNNYELDITISDVPLLN